MNTDKTLPEEKIIYYFGTNLREAGHYTWMIDGKSMQKISLLPDNVPFEPETMTRHLAKGQSALYFITSPIGDFSLLAFSGSPIDKRNGTKSVFWVKGNREDIIGIVTSNEICKQIIDNIK